MIACRRQEADIGLTHHGDCFLEAVLRGLHRATPVGTESELEGGNTTQQRGVQLDALVVTETRDGLRVPETAGPLQGQDCPRRELARRVR
jgi:hypothetical protein